jgi:hypothetical protein
MEKSLNKGSLNRQNSKNNLITNATDVSNEYFNNIKKQIQFMKSISDSLKEIIEDNLSKTFENKSNNLSMFDVKNTVSISMLSYLERINKYTKLEYSSLIICLIYLDRICDINDTYITNLNIHR